MSARIIHLADYKARRGLVPGETPAIETAPDLAERFHFRTGGSGRRYVHTVYSLIECPPMSAGNYILVRRDGEGRRSALSIGRSCHQAPTLNLAEIRQRGAELGANEVHVHLLASSVVQSELVEDDLRTGQFPCSPPRIRAEASCGARAARGLARRTAAAHVSPPGGAGAAAVRCGRAALAPSRPVPPPLRGAGADRRSASAR